MMNQKNMKWIPQSCRLKVRPELSVEPRSQGCASPGDDDHDDCHDCHHDDDHDDCHASHCHHQNHHHNSHCHHCQHRHNQH